MTRRGRYNAPDDVQLQVVGGYEAEQRQLEAQGLVPKLSPRATGTRSSDARRATAPPLDGRRAFTAREFMARPEPPGGVELVGPLLRRAQRTVLIGETGRGKTTLSMQLVAGVLLGHDVLGWRGAGVGKVLVIDLEQGERSIKRGLRDNALEDRDDLVILSCPDGLALDENTDDQATVAQLIEAHRPAAVVIDPFYKAHRADDSNAERPIVDLMRYLDGLRAQYGFGMLVPVHARKAGPATPKARQLGLDDAAGSGAIVRGAEVVLAIEFVDHGRGRLRVLKDRDGELDVQRVIDLRFQRESGFSIADDEGLEDSLEDRIRDVASREPLTAREYATQVGARRQTVEAVLEKLVERDVLALCEPPQGRSKRGKFYAFPTGPAARDQSGRVGPVGTEPELVPPVPLSSRDSGTGTGSASGPVPDSLDEELEEIERLRAVYEETQGER
jgi:hypothetical protein